MDDSRAPATFDSADITVRFTTNRATIKDYGGGKTFGFAIVHFPDSQVLPTNRPPTIVLPGFNAVVQEAGLDTHAYTLGFEGTALKISYTGPALSQLSVHVVTVYK